MLHEDDRKSAVMITGATGFIGHYALAQLLDAGRRCVALLRPPAVDSIRRLEQLLNELGVDAARLMARQRLIVVEGDIRGGIPAMRDLGVRCVIHAAASTRFNNDAIEEPTRTNVNGTARLLEWMTAHEVQRMNLISSAYSCGRMFEAVRERFDPDPPPFHNDYEASKWRSEQLCVRWAADAPQRKLNILRPSVVVGDFDSGRSTRFGGVYLSMRATEFLDRRFADAEPRTRHAIPLRIKGRPDGWQNIVPVDYVAKMIAAVAMRSGGRGDVYHLTHPLPPTNDQIKEALEQYFDIGGGRFVAPDDFHADDLSEHERLFYDVILPIEHYFVDTPTFKRDNAAAVERQCGIICPTYDIAALHRLIYFAQASAWGRRRAIQEPAAPSCAAYFEHFLPLHVPRSTVARVAALSTTVRFVIEDEPNGQWVCRFDRGRLDQVHRGPNSLREEFSYRTSRAVFWDAIAGRATPQELFLSGRAEISGDTERALKMAMILHAFTREFPCDAQTLRSIRSSQR